MEDKIACSNPLQIITEAVDSKLTCKEAATWLRTLSKINKCPGLGDCAEEYKHMPVVETVKTHACLVR